MARSAIAGAVAGDAGADDEADGGVVEDLALVGDAPGLRVGLGEFGGEVVLGGVEGGEAAAGAEHGVDLAVDVVVVDAGDGEVEGFGHGCAQRLRAPSATPRMIRRWKARKTTKTGTSESADMAKSAP